MTRIEDIISDMDLDKLVLRRELSRIEKSLGRLTSGWHHAPPPLRAPPLKTTWELHRPPSSDTSAYRSLIITAYQLQSLIDTADISAIGDAISSFSNKLGSLGMLKENLTVGLWAVDFWKKIVSLSPKTDSNAWIQLAYKLTNASIGYANIGNKEKAFMQSEEAIDIIQRKLDGNFLPEAQELMARNLCTQAINACTPTPTNDIELATRAVLTMEGVLDLQRKELSVDILPASIPERLDSDSFHDSLYSYSAILLDLSNIQEVRGYINEAHATKKRALAILHSLLHKYPNSKRLLRETASVVLDLCNSTFGKFNSLAENLSYAEEGTEKYLRLLQTNFSTYIFSLFRALLSYNHFITAGMGRESRNLLEKISSLAEFAMQRYQDIKLPSESDGDAQFYLASILYYKDLSSEGIYAAHNAVEQYSALAFLDPDRSALKLIRALTLLCKMLQKVNQTQSAIIEGFRALKLVDNAAERDLDTRKFAESEEHISLIDCVMDALEASPPDLHSVKKASIIIARFNNLFHLSEKIGSISGTPGSYMKILEKNGLVDDAIAYGKDFISPWQNKHAYSGNINTIYAYLTCAEQLIDIMADHNRREDALECITNAISIAERYSHHRKDLFIHNLQCDLTSTRIELLCSMGFYKEAFQFAQAESSYGKDSSLCIFQDCQCNFRQLLSLTTMQLYNHLPLQAIETATRAESLVRFRCSQSHTDDSEIFIRSNYSKYLLSDALFDAERTSESLVHLNDIKIKVEIKGEVHSDWKSAFDEDHRLVSATIARIFFVQSDYAQAKQLMIQVLKMGRQLLSEKQSHFATLAIDLLFAGIAFCCVDEHEAGIALLAEVDALQRKFSITNPALAREVEFSLQMQAQRGQWRLIQTVAREKLTCNHVDQALNLRIACMGGNELEFAKG